MSERTSPTASPSADQATPNGAGWPVAAAAAAAEAEAGYGGHGEKKGAGENGKERKYSVEGIVRRKKGKPDEGAGKVAT